ncbi:lasso peptide biosynthesis B2 protein [Nocardiopsis sp. NPDC006938]|uniref:lasso peptide biosynthesis B2 protein n=1 Tax=Nocardiopsis sp. NPDC006938 TaxID=3364337 RepID=UPI00369B072E
MSPRYVTAPSHVAAVDLGPATVLVNYRTGAVKTLIGPAAHWWAELSATGDPRVPRRLDPVSARALLDQLGAAGLLVAVPGAEPWPAPMTGAPWAPSWGTYELAAGREELPRAPTMATVVAAPALVVVLAVLSAGRTTTRMARLVRLLTWATRRAARQATVEQASSIVHAVRRVGRLAPGRVACLEESAAASLALAACGRTVTWRHGVAADPIRLHAWVETDGQSPVAEPPSTARYTPLLTIPQGNHGVRI